MRVGLRVFETVSSAFLAGAAPFTFLEGISFLNQSVGPASGGTYVRVHGIGFNASLQYTLIFSHVRNGVKNSATSPVAAFVSRTLLNVSTPRWNFPFAEVDVTLAINGVPKPLSGSVKFQYVEIVTALLPPSGLVFGTFISFRLDHCILVHRHMHTHAHTSVCFFACMVLSALVHVPHTGVFTCVYLDVSNPLNQVSVLLNAAVLFALHFLYSSKPDVLLYIAVRVCSRHATSHCKHP
jgi:hypothetical protein